jgi:transcription-repair coupling factor (superfamily II helicase)
MDAFLQNKIYDAAKALWRRLPNEESAAILSGCVGGAGAFFLSALRHTAWESDRPRLILTVAPDAESSFRWTCDLKLFENFWATTNAETSASDVLPYPAWDVLPTEADRPDPLIWNQQREVWARLRVLHDRANKAIRFDPPPIISACVQALLQPCPSRELADDVGDVLILRKGERREPMELCRQLFELGYERAPQAEVRGEFARRGGILDVFPHAAEFPYRFDFFDEQIESIHRLDTLTQRSEEALEEAVLPNFSAAHLRKLFDGRGRSASFSDLLPSEILTFWLEPSATNSGGSEAGRAADDSADLARRLARLGPLVKVSEIPNVRESENEFRSVERLKGAPLSRTADWTSLTHAGGRIFVFCANEAERTQVVGKLEEAKLNNVAEIVLANGCLSDGFAWPAAAVACIPARDLAAHPHAETRRGMERRRLAADARPLSDMFELRRGDWVVHVTHGLARFIGLQVLERDGRGEDYLTLLFADDVRLYVPAHQIDLVNKYVGGARGLRASRLGGTHWAGRKARVESAVREIAEDLLRVQATRRERPGLVHPPDGEWQKKFEAAFPFEPTADQDAAIAAVKKDLEATCPMDRLLCGDVGFGKTEVAVRAAFKVAVGGRQVAILAPTTLLAEQHGRTFAARFTDWPLTTVVLSRFVGPREQRNILARLERGEIDVIIGTHRLLQKDVRFRDLGLAVVDEEQRFGVEHKEFFKRLRSSVDVLTLTATPIPRTLHLSLLGLRDISNLTVAPRGRKSVRTHIARPTDELLRRAILREMERGGQVFAVHPRIKDIGAFQARLARVVPESRCGLAHGRLEADELERVMGMFLDRKLDVLISTTIVESGLDIPAANTILIHEADHFGLAELHQLRGRVGRSETQAFCFLLLPEKKHPSPDGLRRLRALEEYEELGAGFQLALKDLELRGAGNILGARQSGHIAEVGYDLYCRLLTEAVGTLQGRPPPPAEPDVTLKLRGAALLPNGYVEEEKLALELYRRLEAARTDEQVDALRDETAERFGPLPEQAARLFAEAKLRRLAVRAGVPFIGKDAETDRLILKLHRWDLKEADRALRGLPEIRGVRILDAETISLGLTLRAKKEERLLHGFIRNVLEPLAERREKYGMKPAFQRLPEQKGA